MNLSIKPNHHFWESEEEIEIVISNSKKESYNLSIFKWLRKCNKGICLPNSKKKNIKEWIWDPH